MRSLTYALLVLFVLWVLMTDQASTYLALLTSSGWSVPSTVGQGVFYAPKESGGGGFFGSIVKDGLSLVTSQ